MARPSVSNEIMCEPLGDTAMHAMSVTFRSGASCRAHVQVHLVDAIAHAREEVRAADAQVPAAVRRAQQVAEAVVRHGDARGNRRAPRARCVPSGDAPRRLPSGRRRWRRKSVQVGRRRDDCGSC